MIVRERLVLIGHPVSQSLSPVMHNAALKAKGVDLRYETLDILPDNLDATLGSLARTKCGGNITIPHKKAAMHSMRVVSDVAQMVGAVNTFWGDGFGALDGDNTDVPGFNGAVQDLLGGIPSGIRVALLGCGSRNCDGSVEQRDRHRACARSRASDVHAHAAFECRARLFDERSVPCGCRSCRQCNDRRDGQ